MRLALFVLFIFTSSLAFGYQELQSHHQKASIALASEAQTLEVGDILF